MYADAKTASKSIEFVGKRSSDYRDALSHYADVWLPDIACMKRCLAPRPGERILEVGAGNGYFSTAIAECLGPDGLLVASDPSVDQLSGLEADSTHGNIRVVPASADVLDIPFSGFDAVWSRGAIHHVTDKTSAFTRFSALARPGGRLASGLGASGCRRALVACRHADDHLLHAAQLDRPPRVQPKVEAPQVEDALQH